MLIAQQGLLLDRQQGLLRYGSSSATATVRQEGQLRAPGQGNGNKAKR